MKSFTDIHWNNRAKSVENDIEVNITDVFQRDLEIDAISPFITPKMEVLEVGCGNGYSTSIFRKLAKHIDAFDCAEEMIKRAKIIVKETNNKFFIDNVLAPQHVNKKYDLVLCIRVLINLRNLDEQRLAIKNLMLLVKPGGLLILAEGFKEGFTALSELRNKVGLPPLEPAKINFYSSLGEILPDIEKFFILEDKFHLGIYDYLTRVLYPLLVGQENVKHNTLYSKKSMELAKQFNPDSFEPLSRMRCFVFRKKI